MCLFAVLIHTHDHITVCFPIAINFQYNDHCSVWVLFFLPCTSMFVLSDEFIFYFLLLFHSFRRMLIVYCLLYALLCVFWSFLCCFSFQFSVSSSVIFSFLNVVPVLWFSVCTADQVTLFSFHFLILTPPPSSDWSMRGGCGLGGCRHLGSVTCDWSLAPFVTLHNQTHSPIHPCRRG